MARMRTKPSMKTILGKVRNRYCREEKSLGERKIHISPPPPIGHLIVLMTHEEPELARYLHKFSTKSDQYYIFIRDSQTSRMPHKLLPFSHTACALYWCGLATSLSSAAGSLEPTCLNSLQARAATKLPHAQCTLYVKKLHIAPKPHFSHPGSKFCTGFKRDKTVLWLLDFWKLHYKAKKNQEV